MRLSSYWIPAIVILGVAGVTLADGGAQHQVKQNPPVKMGTSGGSANDASGAFCCGGTLGSLVLRDGVLCILSNNHVLARAGSAATGEDTVQPGLIDSNCSSSNSNIVGDFSGNIVPLGSANVDAALSTARNNVDASGAILDIGVPLTSTQAPTIGLLVMKSGRTTGLTTGSITSINTSVTIQYQKGCNQGKKFNISYTNQIVTGAMSAGGDSGSLLISNDGTPNPVGLLFAGSASATVYNPIGAVVSAFTAGGHSFSFVGSAGLAPDSDNTNSPSAERLAHALEVKVENETELFQHPGVIGVGIGAAEDNPLEPVIVVYVETINGVVTPNANIPSRIDNLRVRQILTDKFVAQ